NGLVAQRTFSGDARSCACACLPIPKPCWMPGSGKKVSRRFSHNPRQPSPRAWARRHLMTYLLALDQGTSSSRSIVFDRHGDIVAMAQQEFRQIYPSPGWVEHDPVEIWESQRGTARAVLSKAGLQA